MSQNQSVLRWLKKGRTLTACEAAERLNIWRLGARCWDLRRQGHRIIAERVQRGKVRFARYRLA